MNIAFCKLRIGIQNGVYLCQLELPSMLAIYMVLVYTVHNPDNELLMLNTALQIRMADCVIVFTPDSVCTGSNEITKLRCE